MKEISKILQNYLDEHMRNNKKVMFSNTSKEFLSKIVSLMKEGEKSFENASIKRTFIASPGFPKGNDFHFIPTVFYTHIENIEKQCILYSFPIDKRSFKVYFVIPKNNYINENPMNNRIKRIYMWLYVANYYASIKCSTHIDIYLYFTQYEKNLPTNPGSVISQEDVNTAFTTTCRTRSEIYVFREEEWFKVLIHETFHNMGLDFSQFDDEKSKKCILGIFPVKSDVRLYETYCEMWGEIINLLFISYISTRPIENLELFTLKIMIKTQKMITYEKMFSMVQCVKILHHFNMRYTDLYESNSESVKKRKNYKENTQVLSYYILKSIFMYNVNEFIEWSNDMNNGSLNFNKTPLSLEKNIERYCGFIRNHFKDTNYLELIYGIEKWLFREPKKMENQTLRMTVFEI